MIDVNIVLPVAITTVGMLATAWLGTRNKVKGERMIGVERDLASVQRQLAAAQSEIVDLKAANKLTQEMLRVCEEGRVSLLERLAELREVKK